VDARRGVAEVMHPDVRKSRLTQQPVEPLRHSRGLDGVAVPPAEDEVLVLPGGANLNVFAARGERRGSAVPDSL
jgi:hypothetical protein